MLYLIVWFQKLSIPPPRKGFFLILPHLSGNSSQASYINLNFFGPLRTPHPPRNFQSLLWGEYGYFLELHIVVSVLYLLFLSTVYIMQAEPHWRAPSEEVGSLVNYNNYNNKKKYNTSRVSTGHLSNEADLWESSLRQLRETPTSLTTQNFCPATN